PGCKRCRAVEDVVRPGTCPGRRGSEQPFELLLEARKSAAAVDELLVAARPGRVRVRVDVERQRVAFLPVGRVGRELGPVGHDDLDLMVVRMDVSASLHFTGSRQYWSRPRLWSGRT